MARNANLFARPPKDIEAINSGAPALQKYDDAYAAGVKRRIANLAYGGQMGYTPDFTTWVNFHPYVSRNLIPILIEPPLGFRRLPNGDKWLSALKSLVEVMPMSIQGLNAELQVSTATTAFGGAGQEFDSYTNVREQKPDIQFTWTERVGLPIYRFLSAWIRYLMMDPSTKNATINTIEGAELGDLMADQYSMTMLFIEPDELHRYPTQSWLVTNMWPKGTGQNTAKADKANDMEKREITVQFSGIAQYGAGVDDFAQKIMNAIKLKGADPHAREAFITDISGYLKQGGVDGRGSALAGQGYISSTEVLEPLNRILTPKNFA